MASSIVTHQVDEANRWRLETPGHSGWKHTADAADPDKYFMVSVDTHVQEPAGLWSKRVDKKFKHLMPRIEVDEKGVKWVVFKGHRSRFLNMSNAPLDGEDRLRAKTGITPEERLRDMDLDGIDVQVLFPNKGISMFWTDNAEFSQAQCRVYNDWLVETFGPHKDRMVPMAAVATANPESAVEEIQRVARLGFQGVTLPCKPIFGPTDPAKPNYNLPMFDPIWSALVDHDLAVTFHVSTGSDPRAARKDGGAVINYAVHSLPPTVEAVATLCASGVIERFPKLRCATIEAGIGWIPWFLNAMDEAYMKHHMWAFPKLKRLPSEYFRSNWFASFQEDPAGIDLGEKYHLFDNYMWANDYPHHEGTWPHSAPAIERQMGQLDDQTRARMLGLNAARMFKLEVKRRCPVPGMN